MICRTNINFINIKLLTGLFLVLVSCKNSSSNLENPIIIKIQIYEAVPNPEAYELIRTIEQDYVIENLDTTLKSLNVLDNEKYYPITSKLFEFRNLYYYTNDSVIARESPCGFCSYGFFGSDERMFIDSILGASRKMQGKYILQWTQVTNDVCFFSILTNRNLVLDIRDFSELKLVDYNPAKLLSYPIQNYNKGQTGKKVLAIKWKKELHEKITSIFGANNSFVCSIKINCRIYTSGELDTLNSGVIIRDVNENLLDSIVTYFPN